MGKRWWLVLGAVVGGVIGGVGATATSSRTWWCATAAKRVVETSGRLELAVHHPRIGYDVARL